MQLSNIYFKMALEVIGQYLVVVFAIVVLLGLKYYVLNKRVAKQADGYVDPERCVEQLGKQVESGDKGQLLDKYVRSSMNSSERFRNIAIIVAYINSKEKEPKKC